MIFLIDVTTSFDFRVDLSAFALLPATYPLKLILQNTGDVKAEVGAECQQTVKEEYHKAIISWNNIKKSLSNRQSDKTENFSELII